MECRNDKYGNKGAKMMEFSQRQCGFKYEVLFTKSVSNRFTLNGIFKYLLLGFLQCERLEWTKAVL